MLQSINFPLCQSALAEYGSWDEVCRDVETLGVDGLEGIWGGEDIPSDFPQALLTGYHLTFFTDWLDFYRGDKDALRRKFGSLEQAYDFYGGQGADTLLSLYRADLERAKALKAKYVVFHVSDVSLEEAYTYRWLHSDREVIDASLEVINMLLRDVEPTFDFLVENQWWPGFSFTDPADTERLLSGISYSRVGIMLDTGHLMNTNLDITGQSDGAAYIRSVLERQGTLSSFVRGLHLHQSVSGAYVRSHTGQLPEGFPEDYLQRFAESYAHVQRIDQHRPWTDAIVGEVVRQTAPSYLTHELSVQGRTDRLQKTREQMAALRKGELGCEGSPRVGQTKS